jgi:predicted nucleic acid-binding protein
VKYFVLDASVWVARLVPQDEFHQAVKEWMAYQRQEDGQFVSPSLLLAEVAGAISRRTNASFGRRALHQLSILPGLRIVEMKNALMQTAADLAANLGLRGADSVYVAVAKQLDIPLLTLDIEQKERASTEIEIADVHQ